jgi:hypothetical protein
MKKSVFIIFIMVAMLNTRAQEYPVGFAGSGATASVNRLNADNAGSGVNASLNWGDMLLQTGPVCPGPFKKAGMALRAHDMPPISVSGSTTVSEEYRVHKWYYDLLTWLQRLLMKFLHDKRTMEPCQYL